MSFKLGESWLRWSLLKWKLIYFFASVFCVCFHLKMNQLAHQNVHKHPVAAYKSLDASKLFRVSVTLFKAFSFVRWILNGLNGIISDGNDMRGVHSLPWVIMCKWMAISFAEEKLPQVKRHREQKFSPLFFFVYFQWMRNITELGCIHLDTKSESFGICLALCVNVCATGTKAKR